MLVARRTKNAGRGSVTVKRVEVSWVNPNKQKHTLRREKRPGSVTDVRATAPKGPKSFSYPEDYLQWVDEANARDKGRTTGYRRFDLLTAPDHEYVNRVYTAHRMMASSYHLAQVYYRTGDSVSLSRIMQDFRWYKSIFYRYGRDWGYTSLAFKAWKDALFNYHDSTKWMVERMRNNRVQGPLTESGNLYSTDRCNAGRGSKSC